MAYFGVDKQVRIDEMNLQFKNMIRQKGSLALPKLREQFKSCDKSGNGKLELKEFEAALGKYGFFPGQNDLKQLHAYYDVDGDGGVCYEEFVAALSDGKLSTRKCKMLEKLWCAIDVENCGKVKGSDIVAQIKNPDEAAEMMLDQFEGTKGGNQDGCVTKDEFFQLFTELATQYPSDDTFNGGIEKNWKVVEDSDAALDNIRVMHCLSLMRQRLITKANSQQEEYKLRDMFRVFDKDGSGSLSINELAGLLSQLGVTVKDNELIAMMKVLDTSGNGVLEFEEFQQFVSIDPYTKYKF